MQTFDQLLKAISPAGEEGEYRLYDCEFGEDWLQGRTAFGGLSAGLIAHAMSMTVETDRRLRSIAVSFVGPAPAGQHKIRLRTLREGGSVTHLAGELVCNGEVATSLLATFGKGRSSDITEALPAMPDDVCAVENAQLMPYLEGLTPKFTQHYQMAFAHGALPQTGADNCDFGVWMRFKEPTDMSMAALVALGDIPPMPGINRTSPPAVGSSLTWYLEFPNDQIDQAADDWWYMDYRCQSASDSYFHNHGTIWDSKGRAVLYSRQIAMVFQK